MKNLLFILFFILLFVQSSFSQNEITSGGLEPIKVSSEEIYSKCSDAVVMIYRYDRDNALLCYGSGVIVSSSGLVYTNYHVVKDAGRIEIRNGNDIYDSIPFAGFDPFVDAAILKLPDGDYPFINCVNNEDLQVGSSIYALGNPQGYTKTFSYGVISAIRTNESPKQIQISAPISPGSSGGSLLNSNGELIGITSLSVTTGQNMNFAIPVKTFKNLPVADLNDPGQKVLLNQMLALYSNTERIDFDKSVEIISEYCNMYNNDTAKWEFAGNLYFNQGENDSAIKCFTRAIELSKNNQHLYTLRGDCYQSISDTINTLSDYAASLSLCNTCITTYIARANYYHYTLKDYEKAIDDYNMILKINPEYDYVNTQKANCRLSLNDRPGAISELSKSLCWKIDDPFVYVMRAEIYSMLEMYDDAIADYTNSLFYAPQQSDLYLDRAIIYSKKGDIYNAIKDYLEYLKYSPDEVVAHNNLAYAYMNTKDFDQAEKCFNRSISLDPAHVDSFLGLAILNYRQGRNKSTIQFMCKALELKEVLLNGMPGIAELENNGWFWDKAEKKDIKSIFKLMRISDTKIEPIKDPRPHARKLKREAARNGNE